MTLAVANYTGHTVGLVDHGEAPTLRAAYDFGPQAHPHQVLVDGDRLLVSDLGGDCLHVVDPATGPEARIDLGAGSGPRNAVVVEADLLVVALEVGNGAALVRLDRDAAGRVSGGEVLDRVDFAGDAAQTHPSQVIRDSAGRLHLLNRGSDRVCTLTVADGALTLVAEHPVAAWPMDAVEVDGVLLVACRDADAVVALDPADPSREVWRFAVPTPSALAVLAAC